MIPTEAKQKLPRFLAYPLGAQAISDAIVGVPQYDRLSLWFSRHDYEPSDVNGKPITIASRYTRYDVGVSISRDLMERGVYDPRWDVTIYAVPKQLNSRIRHALRAHGLNLLRDWLMEPRTETWLSTSHSLTLCYCPDTDVIVSA